MDIVVDANIIFSSLIKGGKTAELLLSFSLNLFTPEFVIEEIEEHKKEIFEKEKEYRKKGGKFITYFPKVTIE